MNDEIKKMQIQVHLAEYSALRDEILSFIKWKDSLVFVSLGFSGAIFSYAFSQPDSSVINSLTSWSVLYLIAPLATLISGLWMINTLRIAKIGNYINEFIATKINHLLNSQSDIHNMLEWEKVNPNFKYKWEMRIIDWLVYLMTFVVSGILSLILLLTKTTGSFCQRIFELEFPLIFLINSIMVLATFLMFMIYLLKGFEYRKKSKFNIAKREQEMPNA